MVPLLLAAGVALTITADYRTRSARETFTRFLGLLLVAALLAVVLLLNTTELRIGPL